MMIFERKGGRAPVTIIGRQALPAGGFCLVDEDFATWYRKPAWDEDGKLAFYMPDSLRAAAIHMTQRELDSIDAY